MAVRLNQTVWLPSYLSSFEKPHLLTLIFNASKCGANALHADHNSAKCWFCTPDEVHIYTLQVAQNEHSNNGWVNIEDDVVGWICQLSTEPFFESQHLAWLPAAQLKPLNQHQSLSSRFNTIIPTGFSSAQLQIWRQSSNTRNTKVSSQSNES